MVAVNNRNRSLQSKCQCLTNVYLLPGRIEFRRINMFSTSFPQGCMCNVIDLVLGMSEDLVSDRFMYTQNLI